MATTSQIPASRYSLPRGANNQASGGWGDPNVGSGWTNLSNFLNQPNLDYGADIDTGFGSDVAPMDLANGRSQEESSFDEWMRNASGQYGPKLQPIDSGPGTGTIPRTPPGLTPPSPPTYPAEPPEGKDTEPNYVPPRQSPPRTDDFPGLPGNKPFPSPTTGIPGTTPEYDPWASFNNYTGRTGNRNYNF